jgi:site-specific DNA recombinase
MEKNTSQTLTLIAIYARVSTARQEEEETIKTQLSAIREFAKNHGFTIVREYIDDGWSGDTLVRPQLDKLRQDVTKKMWQGVLFYDPDRLARRYSYQELVTDELREKGIEIFFVTTPSPKTGEEKILHGVRGLFAEYERLKIAERFRLGKMRKVRDGHVLLSEAPYGYAYVPRNDKVHGYFEINQEESRVVKMIFEWVANDRLTLRGVVRKLHELGLKPRKSKRGVWNTSTLGHLLRNGSYIGHAHYGKSYAVVPEKPLKTEKYRKRTKTSRKIRPQEEWFTILVPAIVDKKLFERAQRQLKINFDLSNRNKKNEYLLAGKIWCVCNDRRTGEGPKRGEYLYYRCTGRVHTFPLRSQCEERGINARIADSLVWAKLVQLMSSPSLMTQQIKRWADSRRNKAQNTGVDVEALRHEIRKLKDVDARYAKAYGARLLSIDQLREYTTPVREKLVALESQISSAEAKMSHINDASQPTKKEVCIFAHQAAETLQNLNFEERRSIVRSVVDRVAGTQAKLHIYGHIPVQAPKINHVGHKTIDWDRADTNRHANYESKIQSIAGFTDGTSIPFEMTIGLPDPRYDRIIYGRDRRGRITHSTAPPSELAC